MHYQLGHRILSAAVCGVAAFATTASAATVTDHFNDYGTTQVDLAGTSGSATGWAGPWGNNFSPDYYPGVRLTYGDPNYSNAPNGAGANDGAAGVNAGGGIQPGQVATRSFATPLTGTVWVSALARYTRSDEVVGGVVGDTLVWFNENIDSAGSDFIAIRGGTGNLRYNEVNQFTAGTFATDATHLFLARLQVNPAGTDSIEFWINPDLSGGEAGIGTADLSATGVDTFGAALDSVGVSFAYNGSFIDAIRVSNDANGFAQVIPEPAALSLLSLSTLLAMRRRR